MVNLDLYRVFYVVAKRGSLTKAAEELYISQPAVSQSVKQLENQLGVALFNRTHRGMELSEEGGKRIIDRVERALRLFEEVEKEVCATGENGNEEIRISAPEEVFRYVLAEKSAAFSRKFPAVKLRLCKVKEEKLHEALGTGKIDVAVSGKPCLCDESVVAYPTGILLEEAYLAGKKYAEKYAVYSKSGKGKPASSVLPKNLPRIALDGDDESGAAVSGVDAETAKELAAAGAGVVLMPKIFAAREIAEGKLFVLPIEPSIPAAAKPLFVAVNEKSEKEKLISAFLSVTQLGKPV